MSVIINLVIFVGLIAIGVTSSNLENDVIEVSDLQRLFSMIQNGNVDGSLRHDKRQSKSKQGDDHNLMNIQTLNLVFKHNNLRRDKLVEKDDLTNKDANKVNKIMCAITGSYGCSKNYLNEIEIDDNRSIGNADAGADEGSNEPEYNRFEKEAEIDLELLLNDLEKNAPLQEDPDLRCRGNRCGRGRRDREIEVIRCRGDICEYRVDDRSNKDQLRCRNHRCREVRYDNDLDNNKDLRCNGDRCERFRAEDDRGDDDLRCSGNRCGRDRTDGERREDDRHSDLRCRKKRCKYGRRGDHNEDDSKYDSGKDIDELRCKGNRCGEDDEYYDNNRSDLSTDELRCHGNRCGSTRNHIAGPDIDFKSILDNYGKRYKINKDFDAIVLDVDDIENILPSLETGDNSKLEESKEYLSIFKPRNKKRPKKTISEVSYKLPTDLRQNLPLKLGKHFLTLPEVVSFWKRKKLMKNQLGTNAMGIVPGNDNRIVVPASLYNEISKLLKSHKPSKDRGKYKPQLRSEKKSLLPLTIKQKIRLSLQRQNEEKEKALVPFELDLKGLGQVNP